VLVFITLITSLFFNVLFFQARAARAPADVTLAQAGACSSGE
jgi:hypothetical protein